MPHRFELASSNRAGCQNKECKDAKEKIPKGSLRVGSWIDSEKIQAYMWRHWGCTTPRVIENIKKEWQENCSEDKPDYSRLDGYDELPVELQEKVRRALEQGHIDDEDWKGRNFGIFDKILSTDKLFQDAEMNKPGARFFRVPVSRAKGNKDANKAEDKPTKAEDQPTSPELEVKAKTGAKDEVDAEIKEATKGKAQVKAKDEAKNGEVKPKKARANKKNDTAATELDSKAEEKAKPAKKAPKKTTKKEADDEEKEKPAKKTPKLNAKVATPAAPADAEAKPAQRGRPAKINKRKASDTEPTDEAPTSKRRGRPAKDPKAQAEPKKVAPKPDVPSRAQRAARRNAVEAPTDDE
ncbi:zf-PARP-domain-containing protein [Penicillium verhagenii]|nr:zf-PARP-domain-containing protein [Penicillium verhagenii]